MEPGSVSKHSGATRNAQFSVINWQHDNPRRDQTPYSINLNSGRLHFAGSVSVWLQALLMTRQTWALVPLEDVPLLNEASCHEDIQGSGDAAPRILTSGLDRHAQSAFIIEQSDRTSE
jgi:hypothetical protein